MHAKRIIQEFLGQNCSAIHAKRRECLALVTEAARRDGLGLLKLSRNVDSGASLRNRIKQCDRLLSNSHLDADRLLIYRAQAQVLLNGHSGVGIIVDWSDLLKDISQHILRASVVVDGRSITIYEEIHPTKSYGGLSIHRQFMTTLREIIPAHCSPIIITDAGFRSTWFKMLDQLGYSWIGRIRNREKGRVAGGDWFDCKALYASATSRPVDLGTVEYVRNSPMRCRMVLVKKTKKGRQKKTAFGKKTQSAHSRKQATTQREPWLLGVSHRLAGLSASAIVKWYSWRMQIEQTFRDLKNPQWGMGLSTSQTRKPNRLAALLLIGALLSFALWLIGIVARKRGFCVQYGSRAKASQTVSILTLAQHWLHDNQKPLTKEHLRRALLDLQQMVKTYEI